MRYARDLTGNSSLFHIMPGSSKLLLDQTTFSKLAEGKKKNYN